jgi:predicted permease
MTPTARQSAVGFILSDDDDPSQPNRSRISLQAPLAMGRRADSVWRSFRKVSTNPIFPMLILGVLAAAFFFAFVLDAPTNVVLGVLFIGGFTAVIETKKRNDLDPK